MDRSTCGKARGLFAAVILVSLAGRVAVASATYTVTDLGAGTARLASDSVGGGVLITPDGTTSYAFPMTNHALSSSQAQAIIATLPAMTNAPVWSPMTYGDPRNAFSYLTSGNASLNDNGMLVVRDVFGVSGHSSGAGSTVLTAQRQADGSFGPLTALWSSPNNGQFMSNGPVATSLGLNNLGQALGYTADAWGSGTVFLISDPSKGLTYLRDLLPSNAYIDNAIALDNQGRMLVTAWLWTYPPGFSQEHSYLLTPAGVPIDPVPVPEPTALATIAAGMIAFALRRRQRRV
jgi:PEP-CTERM motif